MNLAWSDFAQKYSRPGTGNSYTALTDQEVVELVLANWDKRTPGAGESGLDRKVLVPVPSEGFFCPPRAKLVLGMPVQAEIVARQEGEDPYIQTYVLQADAERHNAVITQAAGTVKIVCYSAAALEENDGHRSSDAEWEIVTILATSQDQDEPMVPLAMARNYLQKPGGTFGDYSAKEFAEAVWFHAQQGIRIKS